MGPFRYRMFTLLWSAATISYIGTFIHLMAAAWLMTELTSSKLFVALIQTASFLPAMICTLPGGLLADHYNRRKLLLITQGSMFLLVVLLVFLVYTHTIAPAGLLLITLLIGIASSFNAPAWQMTISDIVDREHLPNAITLNSLSYNLARAVGPALGGIIVGALGIGAPFIFDAVSYLGLLLALYLWSGKSFNILPAPPSSPFKALFAGMDFIWHDKKLRYTALQLIGFFIPGSAIWALLALVAKNRLHTDAFGYGILFSGIGLGAVVAGLSLLKFREKCAPQTIVQAGMVMSAFGNLGLAYASNFIFAEACCVLVGMAWIVVATSFNLTLQLGVPLALKGRAYAVYVLLNSGALTMGSYLFGQMAEQWSIQRALVISSILLFILFAISYIVKNFTLGKTILNT